MMTEGHELGMIWAGYAWPLLEVSCETSQRRADTPSVRMQKTKESFPWPMKSWRAWTTAHNDHFSLLPTRFQWRIKNIWDKHAALKKQQKSSPMYIFPGHCPAATLSRMDLNESKEAEYQCLHLGTRQSFHTSVQVQVNDRISCHS